MAYLHFIITNEGYNAKFQCTLDGGLIIYFKNGEHIRLDAGKHLLTLDGGVTEWCIQETLNENDCLTIELMLGYDEINGGKKVVGYPEYKITSLDESTVELVEEMIKEFEDNRAAKSKHIKKKILLIASIILVILGLFFIGQPVLMITYGSLGLIGLIVHFIIRKR